METGLIWGFWGAGLRFRVLALGVRFASLGCLSQASKRVQFCLGGGGFAFLAT